MSSPKYWLLKAEPDTRIVKGKDVKFSVDDFAFIGTSPWEGVRNYEARNLMKEMKVGDKAIFYHSNCKVPGIAAFAEVCKEAYPDYTAWDASHPYYDPKSDPDAPKWFMVDLKFTSRAKHFVPLALLRHIADSGWTMLQPPLKYIGEEGANAVKCMDLVTRGRLSVQRVGERAWEALSLIAETGGWEGLDMGGVKRAKGVVAVKKVASMKGKKLKAPSVRKKAVKRNEGDGGESEEGVEEEEWGHQAIRRKRKREGADDSSRSIARRSMRARTSSS